MSVQFPEIPLTEFIFYNYEKERLPQFSPKEQNLRYYMTSYQREQKLLSFLRDNCVLKTTHLKRQLTLTPDGFTSTGANDTYAFNHITGPLVSDYYQNRHRIHLKYQSAPMLIVKGGKGHKSYYPIELIALSMKSRPSMPKKGAVSSKESYFFHEYEPCNSCTGAILNLVPEIYRKRFNGDVIHGEVVLRIYTAP